MECYRFNLSWAACRFRYYIFHRLFCLDFSATNTTAACSRSYWSRIPTLSESEAIVCIFNETDTNTLI